MTRVLLAGAASADAMLAQTLRQEGYEACATNGRAAPCAADLTGIDVVLYGTRDGALEDRLEFLAGASDYLVRPFESTELCASVEKAQARATSSNTEHSAALIGTMLGDSPPMQRLTESIRRVGPTQTPVLIQGETGSGKALVARSVHATSRRSHLPMVVMNCAAVPENLQEAELFGSDAADQQASQTGLLEAAHNSSLFLDDVAELTKGSQAKLLRALQTGENRRLGANTTQPADVRLICACQRDLSKLVSSGQFREDLFYRLNVVSLTPPPLRDRGDDIPRLAEHFLQLSARKLGRPATSLTPDALLAIKSYSWPGNVREMENAIERAVILASDSQITKELLAIDSSVEIPELGQKPPAEGSDPNISLEDSELAERLGISRKSLWERRQRLNIPRKRTRKRAPRRS